mmetsp:Transcript_13942/g.41116  ORF Transcript_13942/g.41116 Transcript_13942/m.41116 type:complete len:417 (+) Transcript_13942:536-1786(+)
MPRTKRRRRRRAGASVRRARVAGRRDVRAVVARVETRRRRRASQTATRRTARARKLRRRSRGGARERQPRRKSWRESTSAAAVAVVVCAVVILLVCCFGVVMRRAIYAHNGQTERCLDSCTCRRGSSRGQRCGSCCAGTYKACVYLLLVAVTALTAILLTLACLALAVGYGGEYCGRRAADGAAALSGALDWPLSQNDLEGPLNATALMESSSLNTSDLCDAYASVAAARRNADAPVDVACQEASFAMWIGVRLVNAPPFRAGLDADRFRLDCSQLGDLVRLGRAQCSNASAVLGGSVAAAAAADEPPGDSAFAREFAEAWLSLLAGAWRIELLAMRVQGTSEELLTPLQFVLGGAAGLLLGASLASFSYSRYLMLGRAHRLKRERAAREQDAAAVSIQKHVRGRWSRRGGAADVP